MDLIELLIERHGWHVLGELAVLALAVAVTIVWVRALFRGQARPVLCRTCGRLTSRATPRCPRCGTVLSGSTEAP